MSKTSNFDKLLTEYFNNLGLDEKGGQWRVCRFSGEKFYVRPEDVDFCRKIKIPLPTLSPSERFRNLLAYQNTQSLFKINSAYSGKSIIATYPSGTPFKIYEHQVWFSDKWDPFDFGRAWQKEKDFFSQFAGLQKDVPRPNLVSNSSNVGSDYTNTSTNLKNCYLTFNTISGENLYYFDCCFAKDCVDCDTLMNCDNCYRCRSLYDSYQCFFCEESRNCLESRFLYDCRNCSNCFMCSNLRNGNYCFKNKQLSKGEYEEQIKNVNLGNYDVLQNYIEEFKEMKNKAVYKPDYNFKSVNSVGEYIDNSKNCYWCWGILESENVDYSMGIGWYRDSQNIVGGGGGELCYELVTISTKNNYSVRFSSQIDNCRDVEYSELCRNCNNCFGCVGLNSKSYCIFNKQYSENEYWEMLDKIKSDMILKGEYGEFFTPEYAPVPYRVSLAATYPGFRDYEAAEKFGYDISEIIVENDNVSGDILKSSILAPDIGNVADDILDKVIFDDKNNKYFRITPYELKFYRRYNLALPREHPSARMGYFRESYDIRLKFYDVECAKCGNQIKSTHNPDVYKNIFCETCYQQEVV